jgi:hypothetical protein
MDQGAGANHLTYLDRERNRPHQSQRAQTSSAAATNSGASMIDDYTRRANQHRPTDADSITAEVRRLHANGYSARDIAGSLHLDFAAVTQMLRTSSPDSRPSSDRGSVHSFAGSSSRGPGDLDHKR